MPKCKNHPTIDLVKTASGDQLVCPEMRCPYMELDESHELYGTKMGDTYVKKSIEDWTKRFDKIQKDLDALKPVVVVVGNVDKAIAQKKVDEIALAIRTGASPSKVAGMMVAATPPAPAPKRGKTPLPPKAPDKPATRAAPKPAPAPPPAVKPRATGKPGPAPAKPGKAPPPAKAKPAPTGEKRYVPGRGWVRG